MRAGIVKELQITVGVPGQKRRLAPRKRKMRYPNK